MTTFPRIPRRPALRLMAVLVITAGLAAACGGAPDPAARAGAARVSADDARRSGVLWQTGMEPGTLSGWTFPQQSETGDYGGGEFDSGSGYAATTSAVHHSGSYSASLVLPRGAGGVRLFRWRELREHRHVRVSAWFYFPHAYRVVGRFFNIFQFKSRATDDRVVPIWYLDVGNAGPGRMRLNLIWWPRTLQGPHRGEAGFHRFRQRRAEVPVGRWFRLRAELRQSSRFDGSLRVWQDRRLLFSLSHVRTSLRNCRFNAACTSDEWSVNNYSDGVRPAPAVIYVDDAQIDVPPSARSRSREDAEHRHPGSRSPA